MSGKGLKCHGLVRCCVSAQGLCVVKQAWGARSGSEQREVFTGGLVRPVVLLKEGGEEISPANEPGVASAFSV